MSIDAPKDLIQEYSLKGFQLIDLTQIPDQQLRTDTGSGLLQYFLKHVRDRDFLKQLKHLLRGDLREIYWHDGKHLTLLLLHYTLEASNASSTKEISQLATRYLSHELGDKVMTLGERLREEGRTEGHIEGAEKMCITIAEKMLGDGIDPRAVVRLTNLPLEKICHLQKKMKSCVKQEQLRN